MAKAPLAPPVRAANLSRRDLLHCISATPLAPCISISAEPEAWANAVKTLAAAEQRYKAFVQAMLRPAYARFNDGLGELPPSPFAGRASERPAQIQAKILAAERVIISNGGNRADILHYRQSDQRHAALRHTLAQHLHLRRRRQRLLRQCRIMELEDEAGDMLTAHDQALHHLIRVPAPDREGALFKLRTAYEQILRHEDHEGFVLAIVADISRLWV